MGALVRARDTRERPMSLFDRIAARPSPWLAYLAVGAVLLVLHTSLETVSLPQSFLYDVVGASAIVVALVGVWRNRPDRVAPWLLMAVGQALFVQDAADRVAAVEPVAARGRTKAFRKPTVRRQALGSEPG